MRKASKQVIHSLRSSAKEHPGWSAEQQEGQAAHAVQLLVGGTCQVIANLQEVSLPHNGTGAPTAARLGLYAAAPAALAISTVHSQCCP